MKHVMLNNIGEHTEIACVLDRSGSMYSIVGDAIGGFNTFLEDQKKQDGEANMSVYLFDDEYEAYVENVDIKTVNPLDDTTFVPRGMTALFDSIGKTITNLEKKINDAEVKPKNVLVVILTDGGENSSKEYRSKTQVKELIERKRNEGNWEFMFLAANQDAFGEAGSFGMSKGNTINFAATAGGVKKAYMSMSKMSSKYRGISSEDYISGAAMDFAANLADEEDNQNE